MRVRKIHTVLAVSVALVLVARSLEARRRSEDGGLAGLSDDLGPVEPVGAPAPEPLVEAVGLEPIVEPEVESEVAPAAEPEAETEVTPVAEADAEVPVEGEAAPAIDATAEPVAEPAIDATAEPEAAPTPETRRLRRRPLAVAAAVLVLAAALAGTLVAVAAGAATRSVSAHHGVVSSARP